MIYQIDLYSLFPVFLIVDASVVDHNVQPAKLVHGALEGACVNRDKRFKEQTSKLICPFSLQQYINDGASVSNIQTIKSS